MNWGLKLMTPSKRKQHEANLIEKEKHEKSQSISSTSKYSDTDYEFGKSNEKKKKKDYEETVVRIDVGLPPRVNVITGLQIFTVDHIG